MELPAEAVQRGTRAMSAVLCMFFEAPVAIGLAGNIAQVLAYDSTEDAAAVVREIAGGELEGQTVEARILAVSRTAAAWNDIATEFEPDESDPREGDCSSCGGSGGGPDRALHCHACRGSGRAADREWEES